MISKGAHLLEYVLECLSVPVGVHNRNGALVYQNAAHQQLFGECLGRTCHPVFTGGAAEAQRNSLQAEGECDVVERLAGGRVVTVRIVRLPEGEGYLSEVVAARAPTSPHPEVETFVQNAAHDLKTPLVSIKGYAELLQRELGMGEGRAPTFLERMLVQAHRMERLLEELLDYARIGTDEAEGRALDPAQAALAAWQSLQDLADPVDASLEIQGPLPAVWCSPTRLQQVFTNLLVNALRYRREGVAPRLRLTARKTDRDDEDRAFLVLEDNGPGVPEEERERIFALFHRGGQGGPGSGVGLAIVRRIVEDGGGAIWVEPASGTGSRFVFSLPAVQGKGDSP